jgi:hypothetical protein
MSNRKLIQTKGNSGDKKDVGMSNQELRREKRRQTTLERLGTNTPCCAECGETDWRCLELHHIAGRDFDADATAILCRNCHRKLSDDQKDHPPLASSHPSQFDRIGHFLLGLADLLVRLAGKCREFGYVLIEYAKTFAEQSQVQP